MANGSHNRGPAQADRIREANAHHERLIQKSLDQLPPYETDDASPAEITGSFQGVTAKLGLPRPARLALGWSLAVVVLCIGLAVAWRLIRG